MSNDNVLSFSSIKTNADIAATKRLQKKQATLEYEAYLEHERRHAARVEERAQLLRSAFKLVQRLRSAFKLVKN